MIPTRFQELSPDDRDRVDAYLDGTISPESFAILQKRMLESPELRAVMRRYLALDNSLQNEGELDAGDRSEPGAVKPWLAFRPAGGAAVASGTPKVLRFPNLLPASAAAAIAFLLGLGLMAWRSPSGSVDQGASSSPHGENATEPSAEGFAVVERLFAAEWPSQDLIFEEGDTLGDEVFQIESGTAEIQFFSGATMTVEGPAEIALRSAWEASCLEGAVRMHVPPAARGFKLHAPSTEIVDLGTEFGLVVRNGQGHVEVFDGEIAIKHRDEKETRLGAGKAFDLAPGEPSAPAATGQFSIPSVERLSELAFEQKRSSFERWKTQREALAGDGRLIAYYTFDRDNLDGTIRNVAHQQNRETDGAVVLAKPVDGRWPEMTSALEFRRPGARVRVNLPGEFPALTFTCWVRIDSLDRWYNALFMGDGYETGEPHWQIRDDGKLMLSVMVDDSLPHPTNPKMRRYHHVYYSPSFWDISMSGQWLHLASVFDPDAKAVSHYVNGARISREAIEPGFVVDELRIGNGEIGNWGQPFNEDPVFSIRNLNGRMDELAVFKVALDDREIAELFTRSRSGQR